jgi:uncharacterized protein (TIGR02145 family)
MEGDGTGNVHQTAYYANWFGSNNQNGAGAKGKSACMCTSGSCATDSDAKWDNPSTAPDSRGNDAYGFRVLPTGLRSTSASDYRGMNAYFWTSSVDDGTNGYFYRYSYNYGNVYRGNGNPRSHGFSVRCIRDECMLAETFTLQASASSICDGDAAVTFSLSGTQTGKKYRLYRNGETVGDELDGTGSAATFTGVPAMAVGEYVYTAQSVADGTYCAMTMNGKRTVTVNAKPTQPQINKPADICHNDNDAALRFEATDYTGTLEWVSTGGGVRTADMVTFASSADAGTKTVIAHSVQTYGELTCYSGNVSQTAVIKPLPTITYISGSTDQTKWRYGTIGNIVYHTTNATGVTLANQPNGIGINGSGPDYAISGAIAFSAEEKVYTYTITPINTTTNCVATATLNGIIRVPVPTYQNDGGCAFSRPEALTSFQLFPSSYNTSNAATLVDERDFRAYKVVKIGSRWIMAENLNYQQGLTWRANAADPNTDTGVNTALIGSFWCPGGSGAATTTTTFADNPAPVSSSNYVSCNTYGALYSWETAMSFNGLGEWSDIGNATCKVWDKSTIYIKMIGTSADAACRINYGLTSTGNRGGSGICPEHWHVPTDYEWAVLLDVMEGDGNGSLHQNFSYQQNLGTPGATTAETSAVRRSKSVCNCAATTRNCATDSEAYWSIHTSNIYVGTDLYGFRVLPAGYRSTAAGDQGFYLRSDVGNIWTSTPFIDSSAWSRLFHFRISGFHNYTLVEIRSRSEGLSVRCIKDE